MRSFRLINVPRLVESEYKGTKKPKYEVGRYSTIWSGSFENFQTSIKDIRYNENLDDFEYLTNYGWIRENNLV